VKRGRKFNIGLLVIQDGDKIHELELHMELGIFFKGLLLGFSIAAPVGPIGVLCIRRTLTEGRISGLVSGLGAASADAFYGFVAGFGLTLISDMLVKQQRWLTLFGGLYLCFLGFTTLRAKPVAMEMEVEYKGLWSAYLSTLVLTLTNPVTILSFVAIFAGLGLASTDGSYIEAVLLVCGVFGGSAAWWLTLSGVVNVLRDKFNPQAMLWVNRLAGIIVLGYGIVALFFRSST
jgi:threonine/homoserine/homoserine lactone efflux protein